MSAQASVRIWVGLDEYDLAHNDRDLYLANFIDPEAPNAGPYRSWVKVGDLGLTRYVDQDGELGFGHEIYYATVDDWATMFNVEGMGATIDLYKPVVEAALKTLGLKGEVRTWLQVRTS